MPSALLGDDAGAESDDPAVRVLRAEVVALRRTLAMVTPGFHGGEQPWSPRLATSSSAAVLHRRDASSSDGDAKGRRWRRQRAAAGTTRSVGRRGARRSRTSAAGRQRRKCRRSLLSGTAEALLCSCPPLRRGVVRKGAGGRPGGGRGAESQRDARTARAASPVLGCRRWRQAKGGVTAALPPTSPPPIGVWGPLAESLPALACPKNRAAQEVGEGKRNRVQVQFIDYVDPAAHKHNQICHTIHTGSVLLLGGARGCSLGVAA